MPVLIRGFHASLDAFQILVEVLAACYLALSQFADGTARRFNAVLLLYTWYLGMEPHFWGSSLAYFCNPVSNAHWSKIPKYEANVVTLPASLSHQFCQRKYLGRITAPQFKQLFHESKLVDVGGHQHILFDGGSHQRILLL